MPRLRRLDVQEVIRILRRFGFEIYSQRGSHIRLQRIVDGQVQRISVAGHGSTEIKVGTLMSIYRDARRFVTEEELHPFFYTD